METDKHYFVEGLFIIGLSLAAAFFLVWLESAGHSDDVLYRIHFAESVSGLALGDPVSFHGVNVGTVRNIAIDTADPRLVQVDVSLQKNAPVKTDTKAILKMKGITGVVFVDLTGGGTDARTLVAVTPPGQVPEIPSEKSGLTVFLESLPVLVHKFSTIEDQTRKVVTDMGAVTNKIKENPTVLLFKQKDKTPPKQ
jgi:phospholipid/cholesterol/gamma-HCH transport system substrate-binding protein